MDERTLARFLAKVQKQDEVTSPHVGSPCWLWTGCTHSWGYGQLGVKIGGRWRAVYAHRLAHEHWIGPLSGLHVCHRCDTPACVNPKHLFLGTARDNARDRCRKGRGRAARGGRHSNAKLSADKVREIRRLRNEGDTLVAIARRFGVTQQCISSVIHRETWAHVE